MKARIRALKPEALTDADLWDLGVETGLPIFQGFTGLWCWADREGRFEWKPRQLKTGVLPYWDGDFARVLDALTTRGFLVRYVVEGKEYGCVRSFLKHQQINNREEPSRLPPPSLQDVDACLTRASREEHASSPASSLKGREGKGRDPDLTPAGAGSAGSALGSPIPFPTDPHAAQASKHPDPDQTRGDARGVPVEGSAAHAKWRALQAEVAAALVRAAPAATPPVQPESFATGESDPPPAILALVPDSPPDPPPEPSAVEFFAALELPGVAAVPDAIGAVFAHYASHGHIKPRGKKLQAMVKARLAKPESFTVQDLCDAIDGLHLSPWHQGQNQEGVPHLDLELAIRDESKVRKWCETARGQRRAPAGPIHPDDQRTQRIIQRFADGGKP